MRVRAFFYSYCRTKHTRLLIHKIQSSSGQWLDQQGDIAQEAVDFFQQLYNNSGSPTFDEGILDYIPSLISANDNFTLDRLPSLDEVRDTVFSLDKNSAPGLDDFLGDFFLCCWSIMG